jgi:DNA-binding NtrC family response regulator
MAVTHTPFCIVLVGELGGRRAEIASALSEPDFNTIMCSDLAEARAAIQAHPELAVTIIDHNLPARGCYELLSLLQRATPACQSIVYCRRPGVFDAMEAMRRGAFWFVTDPCELEQFMFLVSKACIVHELSSVNLELRSSLLPPGSSGEMLGSSTEMKAVLAKAQKIAPLDATVLLTGESGTGKTTLAHYIHKHHRYANGPFISVSCAAIPRDLLESELFGHEKGAFTGANAQRTGAIELAHGGTLFLDEIGDLPLELQPKLLTFLQDRLVKRVGGTKTRYVDVRIIAATHRNLFEMCKRREFREDLLFRINVLSLELPPLRSHPADIEPLVRRALARISTKRGVANFEISADALQGLKRYDWPGNIRELENAIERATAWAEGSVLSAVDFGFLCPPTAAQENSAGSSKVTNIVQTDSNPLIGRTLADLEREAILATLAYHGGDKAKAAKALGVSLKTIYNKLEKLGAGAKGEAEPDRRDLGELLE